MTYFHLLPNEVNLKDLKAFCFLAFFEIGGAGRARTDDDGIMSSGL